MSGLRTAPFRKQNHGKNCWARSSSVRPGKIFADPVCRALDIIEQPPKLKFVRCGDCVSWAFDNSDRRIAFPAKSNVLTEGEPSIAIYMLTRGTAALYKMLADGRRQVVGFALPGDFLGSPFSDRYPYSVDAINEVVAAPARSRYGGREVRRVHRRLASKSRASGCSREPGAAADVAP
jgi:Cyclic nucleotide-binding domain